MVLDIAHSLPGGFRQSSRRYCAPHESKLGNRLGATEKRFAVTPVIRWIRRSDQPNRPKARTCWFFSSFKTLLTSTEGNRPQSRVRS